VLTASGLRPFSPVPTNAVALESGRSMGGRRPRFWVMGSGQAWRSRWSVEGAGNGAVPSHDAGCVGLTNQQERARMPRTGKLDRPEAQRRIEMISTRPTR
jgi:hypothetical protein